MNSKMFEEVIKIPKDRIAALVGVKGKTKAEIEKKTSTRLQIDSKEGDVIISSEESLNTFLTKKIIQAIGRGFNPKIALHLLDEEYILEILNIDDYARKSKKRLMILKGRLIGKQGKVRSLIESLTKTDVEVYGKTVGIIGRQGNVLLAKQAIINLLQGSKHGNVYAYISKHKQDLE